MVRRNLLALARSAVGAGVAVALKAASALLLLVIFALASRTMDREAFGSLAVWFNLLSFAAVIAGAGQPALVLQTWSRLHAPQDLGARRGAYRFSWAVTWASALVVAGALALAGPVLDRLGMPEPREAAFPLAAFAFVATQTLMLFAASATRATRGFLAADVPAEFFWRFAALGVVGASMWTGSPLTISNFLFAIAVGGVLSILAQIPLRRAAVAPLAQAPPRADRRELARLSLSLWTLAIVTTTTQYTEVVLIGLVLSPADAAGYFAAMRIANVFSMITSGLAGYSMTRIASLHFQGERAALQRLHRQMAGLAAAISAPLMALVTFAGPWLLGLFGPSYRSEYPVLLLLSASALLVALTGQAAMALTVTGHQTTQIRIATFNVALRMALIAVFAVLWGATGAAAGALAAAVPLAVGLVRANRRLTGTDPSLLSLLRSRGNPN